MSMAKLKKPENKSEPETARSVGAGESTVPPALTILVVDDHAPSRQFLTTLLSYEGHCIVEASDGLQALAIARAELPDLIISDVLMPTMDGYEFVRQLRGDPRISHTPVIFCTAVYHVEQARALAAACGVFHTICKPAEPEAVLQTVKEALSNAPAVHPALPEEFDREHLKLVTNKLFKKVSQLEQMTIQNSEILDIARQLASEENSEHLLQELTLAARKLAGARFAAIGLIKSGEPLLQSFFVAGIDAQTMERLKPPARSVGLLGRISQDLRPLRIGDCGSDPLSLGFPPAYGAARPFLGAPLRSGEELYGILYLIEKLGADSFSEQDEKIVFSLAAQASVSFENRQRLIELKRYARELELQFAERKRLQEQAYLLSRAVEGTQEMIAIADCQGVFTYANLALLQTLGYSLPELVGKHFSSLLSPNNLGLNQEIGRRSYESSGWKGECLFCGRDGTDLPVYLRTSEIRDERGQALGSVGICEDISERKQAEAQLRAAKEEAEAANRAKSEFLANMSHELRTPMNGIIGMTDLALETELSPEQAEYLQMVKGSADALLVLLNDILDFSKIEAGKLELDSLSFNLRKSLGEVIKTLAIKAQQKGLEFISNVSTEVPVNIIGDPARLRQVLVNLIGNAVKFTDAGEIEIRAKIESRRGAWTILQFSVRDTGIGIPGGKQHLIFEAFSQADSSTTRNYGGSGLGLTISAQLVGLMGGRIWVESEPEKGSAFHFTVQVREGASAVPPEPLDAARLAGEPILIVDDNLTNRRILEDSAILWKMVPRVVECAAAAIQVLQQQQASGARLPLLLTDAHMPEIDGFGLVEIIRRDPSLASVKIVILTSGGQRGDAARCQKLGISAYLSKPFDRLELRDVLLHVLVGGAAATESKPLVTRHTLREQRQSLSFLVAEDNTVNQKLIVRLLEKRGHSVELAQNGKEALEALERRSFDIVLMDGQMPEMDGFEATRRIREKENTRGNHLPIIALTAHAMQGDEERFLAAGMDGYVSKPIKLEELFSVIERVVPS